ncbi:MAG: hypothetical protein ACM3NQ_01735 [Bacteroidales bacterium]
MTTPESGGDSADRESLALDAQLVAVLAAAASVALGAPVAIHHVATHGQGEAERWSRAGRKEIMRSHLLGPTR